MSISENYYQKKVQEYLENEYGFSQWIQVCGHSNLFGADAGFWCGFIPEKRIKESLSDFSWDLSMESGAPGFEINSDGTVYKSRLVNNDEEALLFYRDFHGVASDYVEISQEFILLNNLRYDKKHKAYYAMYESGEQEEAVKYIDDRSIQIKTKFLKKYASAKRLAIVLEFDIRTRYRGRLSDYGLSDFNNVVRQNNICYSINGGEYQIPDTVYSRILGKKIIAPEPIEKCGFWPYEREKEYQDFIIGADEQGNPIIHTCNPNLLNNYFGANPSAPMYLTPVFFSREVLLKYYAKPELYRISDGHLSCQSLWGMEIDNHHENVVAAYLGDLGRDLPEAEQKHWKNYNIVTDDSLSATSIQRDFLCLAAESRVIEHQFKRDYKLLIKRWNDSYGWTIYNSPSSEDEYIFDQIRRPLSDSQAEFDQLILLLSKLIIDLLNEKELSKGIVADSGLRGISKLEQWITEAGVSGFENHISFLRNLWDLRSSGVGHAKGKSYKKAAQKFAVEDTPLPDVFDKILQAADAYLLFMIDNFT